jgi:FkbM family methyltransferase
MDLYHHSNPPFTKWVVAEALLTEPFVVIDIGVQGGEHPRWQFLRRFAEIRGFDPIAEVIDELCASKRRAHGRHYHNLALGNEDGERRFFVCANRFNSSFYTTDPAAEERLVPIRRLDPLYRKRGNPMRRLHKARLRRVRARNSARCARIATDVRCPRRHGGYQFQCVSNLSADSLSRD